MVYFPSALSPDMVSDFIEIVTSDSENAVNYNSTIKSVYKEAYFYN